MKALARVVIRKKDQEKTIKNNLVFGCLLVEFNGVPCDFSKAKYVL